jgi:hypothetical protein
MRREIMFAQIRLHLDDFPDALEAIGFVNEPFSQQFTRDNDGVAVVKSARQFLHAERMGKFPV